MKHIYDEIQQLLNSGLSDRLGFDASRITFESMEDYGMPVEGHITQGVREAIEIPDEYMSKASAQNAGEFLDWLKTQL